MDCPFDPEKYKEMPIGMFHCPVCGKMVLAGFPHELGLDKSGTSDIIKIGGKSG